MGFNIGVQPTKDEALEFRLYYEGAKYVGEGETHEPHPIDSTGAQAKFMSFFLIPMVGRVQREIADAMVDMDQRKGTAKMLTGSATQAKVVQSTVAVDGIDYKGRPIQNLDVRVFDELPSWVIQKVADKIDQINGENLDEDKPKTVGEPGQDQEVVESIPES